MNLKNTQQPMVRDIICFIQRVESNLYSRYSVAFLQLILKIFYRHKDRCIAKELRAQAGNYDPRDRHDK